MLAELGIASGVRAMLISPPDGVLAEAGRLSPRPSFASSIMTAEPADVLAWWPETDALGDAAIAKLRWMLEMANGSAWVLVDPREDVPPATRVEALLGRHSLSVAERRQLGQVTALRVSAIPTGTTDGEPSRAN